VNFPHIKLILYASVLSRKQKHKNHSNDMSHLWLSLCQKPSFCWIKYHWICELSRFRGTLVELLHIYLRSQYYCFFPHFSPFTESFVKCKNGEKGVFTIVNFPHIKLILYASVLSRKQISKKWAYVYLFENKLSSNIKTIPMICHTYDWVYVKNHHFVE
jgi:hypothetical protein